MPLDGLWARAPYLHNGSVPNLWSLLEPPVERPVAFLGGIDILDPINGGFEAPPCDPENDSYGAFCYDTRKPGNSNAGHNFGTGHSVEDRRDLLEYLKTF